MKEGVGGRGGAVPALAAQAVILRENYFQAVGELVLLKFDLGQIRCVACRRLDLRLRLRWRWAGGQTAGEEEQQERDELCFSHSGSPEWRHFTVVEIRRVAQIVSECSGVGLWFARTSLAWVTLLRKSSALPNTKLRSLRRHNWFVNAGARLSAEDVNGPLPQR